jgi:O-antigen ligase
VAASACAAAFPGVASLEGAHRNRDGAIVLAALALIAAGAAIVTARTRTRDDPLPAPHRIKQIAVAVVAVAAIGLVAGAVGERPSASELAAGARPTRLTTVSSNRYEYWRVGLRAFEREPITGLGAAGFRVFWLQERDITEAVRDVHSLELEMAAELGIVGLLAFAVMVGGVAVGARRALRADPVLAAGCIAALTTWFVHASLDWDWELPAVSLPAVVLAGTLLARAETSALRDAGR